MAENPQKRPTKGILKNSSSFDKQHDAHSQPKRKHKETTFDEMNILATLHPPGKDYGHMKINEPKTPYNYGDDDENEELDATILAERIRQSAAKPPKFLLTVRPDSDGEDFGHDDDDEDLTEEEKQRKKLFRMKRSKHYNEFQAVQVARQLIEEDECDDSDSDKLSKCKSPTKSPSPFAEGNTSSSISKSNNYQPGSSKRP